ncbi:MAG: ComEC/Rec2 family competence protein [Sphingobacteriia bacterium]|nr:ComEC/Rec2 family competence protein [Sphingobacteriia bacterium]
MMPAADTWKRIPIIRLLLLFVVGIIVHFYMKLPLFFYGVLCMLSACLWLIYQILPLSYQFSNAWMKGIGILFIFFCTGAFVCHISLPANQKNNICNVYTKGDKVSIVLLDKPVEKNKRFKVLARAESVEHNSTITKVTGNVIVYFRKDSFTNNLACGSTLIVSAPLQPIHNSGNPGAFNYEQYCLFQNIAYQTFLNKRNYSVQPTMQYMPLLQAVLQARDAVLNILQKHFTNRNDLGIAEALLIGYREDLDKDIVQAYSNTGVVHIIAISGLHLGMIYGLLLFLFKPFDKIRLFRIIKPLFVLSILWGFTFIAGAAPSITRSAIMFSFIVTGELFNRKTSILNNLAVSAFFILLFAPFSLWDVGFQLSYAAVLSIVLFSHTIEKVFFIRNKILHHLWQLSAVTISAQILTMPFILYHFHQFPNLFLLSNLVAVPLSGFILYGELLLLAISFISTPFTNFIASCTSILIECLNKFILFMDSHPNASWNGISISIFQAIALTFIFIGFFTWVFYKNKKQLWVCLSFATLFCMARAIDFIEKQQQHKLIVFNVPSHSAIDIVEGRRAVYNGDKVVMEDNFLRNFHLQPSRIQYRYTLSDSLYSTIITRHYITTHKKTILLIDDSFPTSKPTTKIQAAAVILKQNTSVSLAALSSFIACPLFIADASNMPWKINRWKKEAEKLHLRLHSVTDQGAFVMEL